MGKLTVFNPATEEAIARYRPLSGRRVTRQFTGARSASQAASARPCEDLSLFGLSRTK